jgi:DNA-binding CsgD family transcriptional regulator
VVGHHLLVVDPTGRGYAFRHELTRDAVYDDMLPGERVRLHAVYGAALTGDPALLGDDSAVAATLAHHWDAAGRHPARLAEAQVAAGCAEAATATARECLALADDLGATVAADVRDLARRARLHIEPAAPVAPDPQPELRFRLTDREREVLALVAEGHSNGRIATALFISPKTASVHVSNILAKLGVTSRTEAATTAYRHGLLSVAGSIGA